MTSESEHPRQFVGRIYEHIGTSLLKRMGRETIVHGHRPEASVAPSFDVDMRVPDNRGFLRTHSMLFEQPARAFGVGLLGGKAVSPIDLAEERAQPERFHA